MILDEVKKGKALFIQYLLSGCTVAEFIKEAEHMLAGSIIISTANRFVWYSSDNIPKDCEVSMSGGFIVNKGIFDDVVIEQMQRKPENKRVIAINNYQYVFGIIGNKNGQIGYSYMVGKNEFTQSQINLFHAFCDTLGVLFSKSDIKEHFLLLSDEEAILKQLLDDSYFNFNMDNQYYDPLLIEDVSDLMLIHSCDKIKNIPLGIMPIQEIKNKLGCDICFEYKNDVIILSKKGRIAEQRKSIEKLLFQYNFIAGVGYPINHISRFRECYEECLQVLECYEEGQNHLLFFSEYIFTLLLKQYSERQDLLVLCNLSILKVYRYDEKNNTSLCKTLLCYFKMKQNVNRTAKQMGIHRNTVLDRLNKAKEISGSQNLLSLPSYLSLCILFNIYPQ